MITRRLGGGRWPANTAPLNCLIFGWNLLLCVLISPLTVMNSDSCALNSLYLWAVCSSWKGCSLLQRSEQGSGWLYSNPLLLLIGFKMTRHYLKLNDKERRKEGGRGRGRKGGGSPWLEGLGKSRGPSGVHQEGVGRGSARGHATWARLSSWNGFVLLSFLQVIRDWRSPAGLRDFCRFMV